MCAINGFNFKDPELIKAMNALTGHRGPDATRVYEGRGITLGHNRLSIIDISDQSAQPMKNTKGNLAIVFNGEIYNFQELRKELAGYPFKSSGDTEVILAAYEKWGKECVKKFNGIFAFAIWDEERQELFVARDPMGVKPLYYSWDNGRFVFSSEIKAISEHRDMRRLNRDAFNRYLRVLYVPEPLTMIEGIYKLPAASYGAVTNGKLSIERYWQPGPPEYLRLSREELAGMVRKEVTSSVKRQMISDRPLGVYLSGGIDSSVVLHSMSELRKDIDTFSVGFELTEGEEASKFNQDFLMARRTAAIYGTKHHEVLLSVDDVAGSFEQAVWHMDEPISNPTALALFKLARFTKGVADVVLGGDGGDELFGGYDRYRMSRAASLYGHMPEWLKKLGKISPRLSKLSTPPDISRFSLFMFQKDAILKEAAAPDFLELPNATEFFSSYFATNPFVTFEELLMEVDRRTWLTDFSLMLTDTMSMAAGVEARVPLLDLKLAELARTIPLKHKVSLGSTKIILKDAFRRDLPSYLFSQPKRGFFSPGAKWLRYGQVETMARSLLSAGYNPATSGLFNWPAVQLMLDDHIGKRRYNLTMLWALMTFQSWARQYKITL